MNIFFEKVLERDVDLMIINQISFNKSFLNLFLDKISKKNYIVESIEHSLMDQEDGESDISVKAAAHCPHSNPLKFSQNRGNDLFTHSQPVTVTGSVQMLAATAADMAMR